MLGIAEDFILIKWKIRVDVAFTLTLKYIIHGDPNRTELE